MNLVKYYLIQVKIFSLSIYICFLRNHFLKNVYVCIIYIQYIHTVTSEVMEIPQLVFVVFDTFFRLLNVYLEDVWV